MARVSALALLSLALAVALIGCAAGTASQRPAPAATAPVPTAAEQAGAQVCVPEAGSTAAVKSDALDSDAFPVSCRRWVVVVV